VGCITKDRTVDEALGLIDNALYKAKKWQK